MGEGAAATTSHEVSHFYPKKIGLWLVLMAEGSAGPCFIAARHTNLVLTVDDLGIGLADIGCTGALGQSYGTVLSNAQGRF